MADGGPSSVGTLPTGSGEGGVQNASGDAGALDVSCDSTFSSPTSIAGTWDVQGSMSNARATTALLVIDASHFTFAVTGGASLTFSAVGSGMSLVWQDRDGALPISTSHAGPALQQGIIPLGLGGSWTFAARSGLCQADIRATDFTAMCSGVSGLPNPLPYDLDGIATGQRTKVLPSSFGDLGGVWHLTLAGSLPGSNGADATFAGNTLSIAWTGAPWGDGTVTLAFCDGIAGGTTSGGVEFSAHRR